MNIEKKGKIHMKIKVLLVMPEHEVQTVKIPRSSKFIKALIGKELLKIRLDKKERKNDRVLQFCHFFLFK